MCTSKARGGRRCPGTPYGRSAARLRKVLRDDPGRAAEISGALERLDLARQRYGTSVSPMDLPLDPPVRRALEVVSSCGTPLIVGGAVRDSILGTSPKDVDIEVHGAPLGEIAQAYRRAGYRVDEAGRAFGVLKVSKRGEVSDLDIAVPRRERQVGRGHSGFTVEFDDMTVAEAAERRDFTVNAMYFDPELRVLVDPYAGADDLRLGILRAVSDRFAEDPLRVLRGAQMAARFGLTVDEKTALICKNLRPRCNELPIERIQLEWDKLLSESVDPERGLQVLRTVGWDDTAPGLRQALGTPGVGEALGRTVGLHPDDRRTVGAAVLLAAAPPADRMGLRRTLLCGGDPQRIAFDLAETDPADLGTAYARKQRAHTLSSRGFTFGRYRDYARAIGDVTAIEVADSAIAEGLAAGPEEPLIAGRDLISRSARRPGPWVGMMVNQALERQHRGDFSDRSGALAWLDEQLAAAGDSSAGGA